MKERRESSEFTTHWSSGRIEEQLERGISGKRNRVEIIEGTFRARHLMVN